MSLGFLFFLYVSAGTCLLLGIWMYYERRDKRVYQMGRRQSAFHCVSCGHLYSAPQTRGDKPCPRCSFKNTRLRF
ncbi:MAG: hypothetical protein ACFBZ8_09875 [Opitutales bacterium]